jgi:phage tail tube protein FII
VPWCRFFIPKIASPSVKPGDPDLNDNISYAKCIKGHVLRDASGWIQCENLPASDAKCWQEGGETLLTLNVRVRRRREEIEALSDRRGSEEPTKQASKS